ncbi:helix-turn-helix transcriptional regulator [Sulfuricurvum sp.]|uniref:helix-turn-helix domain-containing protein n=1 Tax=Sulfuricurvum sp. TaxID=2025608 RepID=UPI0026185B0D|nr:helix-turn-helix transcriptional regulator [Sulfuricurvum sp.]MDD3595901.1 helix-turn-helix transcriptional regulator [Sulfuricurvum sp.]
MRTLEDLTQEDVDELYRRIGRNVKALREHHGLTQLDLSLAMNLKSPGLISQAELYLNTQHFNIKHLYQISHILECDITDFFKVD